MWCLRSWNKIEVSFFPPSLKPLSSLCLFKITFPSTTVHCCQGFWYYDFRRPYSWYFQITYFKPFACMICKDCLAGWWMSISMVGERKGTQRLHFSFQVHPMALTASYKKAASEDWQRYVEDINGFPGLQGSHFSFWFIFSCTCRPVEWEQTQLLILLPIWSLLLSSCTAPTNHDHTLC